MPFEYDSNIFYIEEGDNTHQTLIFLHGRSGNSLSWWRQLPSLSKKFHCISIDVPGFGKSIRCGERMGENLCKQVRKFIKNMSIEFPILIVQSLCGFLAYEYSISYPDELKAIIYTGAMGFTNDFVKHYKDCVQKKITEYNAGTLTLRERTVAPEFYKNNPSILFLHKQIQNLNPEPNFGIIDGEYDFNGLKCFPNDSFSNTHSMFIVGEYDIITPLEMILKFSKNTNCDRISVIPKCGHSCYIENYEQFNQLVSNYVTQLLES